MINLCRYAKGNQGKAAVTKKPPLDMVCVVGEFFIVTIVFNVQMYIPHCE